MERAERIGLAVSGGAHAALILWVAVGDWLFSAPEPQDVEIAEVAMISGAEFDALVAAAAAAPRTTPSAPAAPTPPAATEAAPAPAPETAANVPPQPAPPEEAAPDDAPDVIALAPPQAEVQDAPPNPILAPVIEPSEQRLPEISLRPRERPAQRVAPTPAEAPAPDAAPAPDTLAATRPEESTDPVEVPPDPVQEAAPEEAGTVIETEENRTEEPVEVASAAPQSSIRPRARPDRQPEPETPAAPAVTPAAPAADPAPEPEDAIAAAVAAAVAEGAAEGTGGTGTAPVGPPLTSGERDALIVAVKQCWNLGALSSDALRTVVTVGVRMTPEGRVESVRQISTEGGTEASTKQAYEAARRAVERCGQRGFPLPPEKYDHWRDIEIVFNPESMRLR